MSETIDQTYDNLIAGDYPKRTEGVTLASGQNLKRGAVLGKITASGNYTLSESAAADGSQTIIRILAEDCDASTADTPAMVYISGEFAGSELTIGTGHSLTTVKTAFDLTPVIIR